MEWFLAAVAVLVLGVAAFAATGRLGELPDVVDDRVAPELPDRPLTAADLTSVGLAVVPRGYSMAQVDALLDRVGSELPPTATARADQSGPTVREAEAPRPSGPAGSALSTPSVLQPGPTGSSAPSAPSVPSVPSVPQATGEAVASNASGVARRAMVEPSPAVGRPEAGLPLAASPPSDAGLTERPHGLDDTQRT